MSKNKIACKVRKNHKPSKRGISLKVRDVLFLEKGLIGKILEQLEQAENLPTKDKILKQSE